MSAFFNQSTSNLIFNTVHPPW
uniref:Uncharacterized protein n=1 Tax=Strongyloides venezuelensis TaxID=75913 RepID=A0A0K0FX17_STRVS